MFDENTRYNSHDIDLLQAVIESMLERVYEAHNFDEITRIREMKESDEEENDDSIEIDEDLMSSVEKKTDRDITYLSSSDSSDISFSTLTSTSSSIPTFSNPASSASLTLASASAAEKSVEKTAEKSEKTIKSKKMIDLDIDMINIIFEEVRRRRKALRKHAYVIMLNEISDEEISSFIATFSTFVNVETFYKENARQMKKNLTALIADRDKNLTFRLHRDVMPSKLLNFR